MTSQAEIVFRREWGRARGGLILPGVAAAGRLEPAGSFNALFTHRSGSRPPVTWTTRSPGGSPPPTLAPG